MKIRGGGTQKIRPKRKKRLSQKGGDHQKKYIELGMGHLEKYGHKRVDHQKIQGLSRDPSGSRDLQH